jgi:hypothetical protein
MIGEKAADAILDAAKSTERGSIARWNEGDLSGA